MISDYLKSKLKERRDSLLVSRDDLIIDDVYYITKIENPSDIELSTMAEIEELGKLLGPYVKL